VLEFTVELVTSA